MAANHVAMVRSSARRAHEMSNQDDDTNLNTSNEYSKTRDSNNQLDPSEEVRPSLADELSQLSVISINSSTTEDVEQRSTQLKSEGKSSLVPEPMVAKLRRLENVSDIDDCVDPELSQERTIDKLEQNWRAISNQFQTLVEHLTQCSKEVSIASEDCLGSLVESIEITCDKVDAEMKALYHLMSKCDELTTKLSIAGSFREEIKTLRKSVETLEALYRNKPKQPSHRVAQRRQTTATTTRTATTDPSVSSNPEGNQD